MAALEAVAFDASGLTGSGTWDEILGPGTVNNWSHVGIKNSTDTRIEISFDGATALWILDPGDTRTCTFSEVGLRIIGSAYARTADESAAGGDILIDGGIG